MGRRMSLWIPDDRLWIFSVVEEFQKKAEAEGIPLSQGDIILAILEESWAELRKKFHRSKIKIKKKKKGKSLRRMVVCRQRDSWLFDYLDKIVETKKDVGIRTSFSYELTRVARNGLIGSIVGAEEDRRILT